MSEVSGLVAGWSKTISGVELRIVHGYKSPDDLRIEWWDEKKSKWRPIHMELAAVLVEFFFDNEERLYPRTSGYKGGQKFWDYLVSSVAQGFELSTGVLLGEKLRKRAKERAATCLSS